MRFHYTAARPDGKVVEGDHDADNSLAVLTFLGTQGLRPISVREATGFQGMGLRSKIFGQVVTVTDKIFLTKYLALMLRVGTDLFRAIDILVADFNKPVVKGLLIEIRAALEKGQPFYSTFVRYPRFFSPVFVNMVKAGESSGNLEQVLNDLTISLEKEKDLRSRLRAAFIYPLILAVLAFVIIIFLVTFALPKIASVFQGGQFKPPLFSRIVFGVGLFINEHIVLIMIFFFAIVLGGYFFLSKSLRGRSVVAWLLYTLPVIRGLTKKLAIQRFATTLSSLMKAGLPILDALEITADAVGHREIGNSLRRISREDVSRGSTLGDAFRKEAVFPSVVSNLVAISEKAGHLGDILDTLGQFYEAEVDSEIKTVVAFVEPVMLLVMGLVVGFIALSIIIPIYQLVSQIT